MLTWNLLLHLQHEYLTTRVVLFISKVFSSNHRSLLGIDLISPPFPPKISSVTHNCRTLTANCAYCQYCTSQELETWYTVSPLEHRTERLLTESQCVVCINVKVGVGSRGEVNTRGEVWNVCAKNGVSLTLNTITVITWTFNQRYLLLFSCFQLFYWGSGCLRTQTRFQFSMNHRNTYIYILVTNHRNHTRS